MEECNDLNEEAINPCPPDWLNNEDNALLRGDAIGDTAYTHRWILNCLFTITKGLPKYLSGECESTTDRITKEDGTKNTSTEISFGKNERKENSILDSSVLVTANLSREDATTENLIKENTATVISIGENTATKNLIGKSTTTENLNGENTSIEISIEENTATEILIGENTATENLIGESTATENLNGENTATEISIGKNTATENSNIMVTEEQENLEEISVLELDCEVEEAACQLWDMTVEKDVSHHLLHLSEFDILSLASLIFNESRAPRLTEVMVGVVANLCCEEEGCTKVLKTKDGDEVLLSALELFGSTSDIPTLCEVMRMIRLLLWHCTNRTRNTTWAGCPLLKLLCQEKNRNTITFLIQNSLSDTLIAGLLELLSNFLYISLPEIGLSFSSLYSVEGIVNGIIDILERKCCKFNQNLEVEQEKIINLAILCLYAFIDTPGERLIQLAASSADHKLESTLISCLEHEGRVDSSEALVEEVCERLTRIVGLSQIIIPFITLPPLLMTIGRLMALVEGETLQYTVKSPTKETGGRKGSLDDAVPIISTDSKRAKRVRWKSEGHRNEKTKRGYKMQFSNPLAEEYGWVSPPSNATTDADSFVSPLGSSPVFSPKNNEEASSSRRSSSEKILSRSTSNLANLKELEEVLGDYCFNLISYWWASNSCSRQRYKEAQKIILDVLDQCHAHEVLLILNAVRLKDQSLVPKLQEEILDSGSHRRLVALLAHMYQ